MSQVLALSLHRPWAWLILHGGKDVENRTWDTGYRGSLILHSAQGVSDPALASLITRFGEDAARQASLRGFVGLVDLLSVHSAQECGGNCSPWAARSGMHWMLAKPRPFSAPVPGPGSRGLFAPPPRVFAAPVLVRGRS